MRVREGNVFTGVCLFTRRGDLPSHNLTGRQTPLYACTPLPPKETEPSPIGIYPSSSEGRPPNTVNRRTVRILLEGILVHYIFP